MNNFRATIDFIRKLYHEPTGKISLHEPRLWGNEKKYLEECIDTTYVSSVGKFVDKFEQQMAVYTGAKHAVVCVNGTAALHMALILCGVKPGDEVLTQPLTFIATANAISYTGAQPIFLDVDLDTLGMSPKNLRKFIETNTTFKQSTGQRVNKLTGRPITACIPMHTFGHPCRIDEIAAICNKNNIALVEDAAESLGSTYNNKHTGTFGKIGIQSFNGNKILTTGGGGMILTNDVELAAKAKHLTTQARVPQKWEFFHDQIGYNYRMPNINAALGVAQLEMLDQFLKSKRLIADNYKNFFSTQGIEFFSEPSNAHSNYWLNVILLKDRKERDEFLEITNANGILTRPAWVLMNKLPMFKNCQTDALENCYSLEDRLVNLPSSASQEK